MARLLLSSASSPDDTICFASGPRISSKAFSSLLCIAVNSVLLASSGEEKVFWPRCCAAEGMEHHSVSINPTAASLETLPQENLLQEFSDCRIRFSISKFYKPVGKVKDCRSAPAASPPPSAVKSAAPAVKPAATTEAGASTRRETPGLPAVVVAAKRAGADAALAAMLRVPSSCLIIPIEGSRNCARVVVDSVCSVRSTTAAVEVAAVIKRPASGIVPRPSINRITAVPIESPVAPTPTIAAKPAHPEAESERKIRPAKPNSGIRVPSRPRINRASVNQPWIVCGNVNYCGVGRLNDDRRTLRGHRLLRSRFQVARIFRPFAHHLNSVHYILLLVVISIAQR